MSPAAVLSSHRLCAPRWGRGRLSGRADRRSTATLTGVVTSGRRSGARAVYFRSAKMCGHGWPARGLPAWLLTQRRRRGWMACLAGGSALTPARPVPLQRYRTSTALSSAGTLPATLQENTIMQERSIMGFSKMKKSDF